MFAKTLESAGPTLPAEAAELEGPWGGGLTDEEGALLYRCCGCSIAARCGKTSFDTLSSTCAELLAQPDSDDSTSGLASPEMTMESVGGGDDEEDAAKPQRKRSATGRRKRSSQKSS